MLELDIFGPTVWLVKLTRVPYPQLDLFLELTTGDNFVISQQTARACLKYLSEDQDLPPNAEYLSRRPETTVHLETAEDWKKTDVQLEVLELRARQAIIRLAKLGQKGTRWTDLNMDCVAASRAHIELFLLRTFTNILSSVDTPLHPILLKLKDLVRPSPPKLRSVCVPYPHQSSGRIVDL
jgi:Acyl-CoA oxidase